MGAISSIASAVGISEDTTPVSAAIGEIDVSTGRERTNSLQSLQYFPQTISDNKSPEYARKNVPGGSHPISSFINGGERMISFSAVFTQDENPEALGAVTALLTGSFNFSVSSLFNSGTPRKDTADIASAIAYLRSFTYPEYKNDVALPPPIAVIYLPNSGIIGHPNMPDSITGVMTQCDVVYEAFHRNGAPRVSVVSLGFLETVQIGPNWRFVGRERINGMLTAMGHGPYIRNTISAVPGANGSAINNAVAGDIYAGQPVPGSDLV